MTTPNDLLHRLDARHNELIRKLDELNAQIEEALAGLTRSREGAAASDVTRTADDVRQAA
jgi:hypothetical protein